jgi:hypothetical protein
LNPIDEDEVRMIGERQASDIAEAYLKRVHGSAMPVRKLVFIPGVESAASEEFPYCATWAVWFVLEAQAKWTFVECPIYVDATTGEPWEIDWA